MNSFTLEKEGLEDFTDFIEEDVSNVRRAMQRFEEEGFDSEFIVHAKAETVEESAENTGIEEKEIVKTLVFIGEGPVAVLAPGHRTVSEEKLEAILGEQVRLADPEEVREASGYRVGGVSPFDLDIPVFMEEGLMQRDRVKPAAGSRVVGVSVRPEDLKEMTGAELVDVMR